MSHRGAKFPSSVTRICLVVGYSGLSNLRSDELQLGRRKRDNFHARSMQPPVFSLPPNRMDVFLLPLPELVRTSASTDQQHLHVFGLIYICCAVMVRVRLAPNDSRAWGCLFPRIGHCNSMPQRRLQSQVDDQDLKPISLLYWVYYPSIQTSSALRLYFTVLYCTHVF